MEENVDELPPMPTRCVPGCADQHGLTANMIVEIAREFAREIATCCKLLPLTVGAWMG